MNATTLILAAGAALMHMQAGKFLSVKTCTLPLNAAFNGGPEETIIAGTVLDQSARGIRYVNFRNPNSSAVTVTFYIEDAPVTYQPADNAQSNAGTFIYGNLGVAVGAGAAGGLPACDANGFLQITNAMALKVSGTYNGHRRQIVTLTMAAATVSAFSLNILDGASGNVFMTILPGAIISLPIDADLWLSGAGGTAAVSVGQVYLNQN